MPRPTRRSLLVASGSALLTGTAGCLGRSPAAEEDETTNSENDTTTSTPGDTAPPTEGGSIPDGARTALEYLYVAEDAASTVRITRPTVDTGIGRPLERFLTNGAETDWLVRWRNAPGPQSDRGGIVATGTFEVDTGAEAVSTRDGDAGVQSGEFDHYRLETGGDGTPRVLATDGEGLLLGPPDWVDRILSRRSDGQDAYLDTHPRAKTVLETIPVGPRTVVLDGDEALEQAFPEDSPLREAGLPSIVGFTAEQTDDRVRFNMVAGYDETPDAEDRTALERFAADNLGTEPDVEIREEEALLVFDASRPYTPPEERPETAGHVRFVEYDQSRDVVVFRFQNGEELPVDRFELEIDDEVYEGDWAGDQETIGEGDEIAIDADAVEPGDSFSVSYESPDAGYSSTSGTSILRRLPFAVDFDPDDRTGTLRYVEGPPLPADRVSVAVEEDGPERQPWNGTVTKGDAVELGDLPIEGAIEISYERADGETVHIGHAWFAPPGEFRFEYDGGADTMTVTYRDIDRELDEERPAWARHRPTQGPLDTSRYEIRVDGEPAPTQWSDLGEQIEPGDAVTLSDVPVDTPVSIVWLGADGEEFLLDETRTVPSVTFEFSYDEAGETVTVRHSEGEPVAADKLSVEVYPDERTVEWTGTDTVSRGDELEIDDVGTDSFVAIEYTDRGLAHRHVREIMEESPDRGTPATDAGSSIRAPF